MLEYVLVQAAKEGPFAPVEEHGVKVCSVKLKRAALALFKGTRSESPKVTTRYPLNLLIPTFYGVR